MPESTIGDEVGKALKVEPDKESRSAIRGGVNEDVSLQSNGKRIKRFVKSTICTDYSNSLVVLMRTHSTADVSSATQRGQATIDRMGLDDEVGAMYSDREQRPCARDRRRWPCDRLVSIDRMIADQ